MLIKCTCSGEQQDAMYGKGVRVMNATSKRVGLESDTVYRCTVCGKETTAKGVTK